MRSIVFKARGHDLLKLARLVDLHSITNWLEDILHASGHPARMPATTRSCCTSAEQHQFMLVCTHSMYVVSHNPCPDHSQQSIIRSQSQSTTSKRKERSKSIQRLPFKQQIQSLSCKLLLSPFRFNLQKPRVGRCHQDDGPWLRKDRQKCCRCILIPLHWIEVGGGC